MVPTFFFQRLSPLCLTRGLAGRSFPGEFGTGLLGAGRSSDLGTGEAALFLFHQGWTKKRTYVSQDIDINSMFKKKCLCMFFVIVIY